MGTRFTRVTVVGDHRQVDISLPADAPLAEQLPMVLRLLSVPSTPVPVRWTLSTSEHGTLQRDRSLDEVGILDGAVLYLVPASAAPPPPYVDDVEAAAAAIVGRHFPAWHGPSRRSGVAVLLGVVLAIGLAVVAVADGALAVGGPVAVAVLALVVAGLVAAGGGLVTGMLAVPAAAVAALNIAGDIDGQSAAAGAVAAAAALTLVGAVRRQPGLVAGGLTALAGTATAWISLSAGAPADRTAGLVLLVAVISAGLAGQLALGGAGLVNLMVADEQDGRVPRTAVLAAVRRGQAIATAVVWAACVLAATACAVLLFAASSATVAWVTPALGGLGGLIFTLRSRMFTRARQIGPMLGAGVTTAAAAAVAAPSWWGLNGSAATGLTLGLLAALAAVVAAAGFSSLPDVPTARLRRLWERLEVVAVLALVPGLILLFDAIGALQRWIG